MLTEFMLAGEQGSFEAAGGTRSDLQRAYRLETCDADHTRRGEAERFVQERFHRTHGAQIRAFMPTLLVCSDSSQVLRGVLGCRPAAANTLFLERYLSESIESVIAKRTGARVRREEIVEVGNFACAGPQAATRFVALLPRYLIDQGHTWVVFTATRSVRRILRELGARCAELGVADGACAGRGPDDWGRYYDKDPRVLAGYLPLARSIPALWSVPGAN